MKDSHPEVVVLLATMIVPPPNSAQRYFPTVTDFNCNSVPSCRRWMDQTTLCHDNIPKRILLKKIIIIITKKSLFGMASKREGLIHPSVTSQPPRLTARTRKFSSSFLHLPLEIDGKLNDSINKKSINIGRENIAIYIYIYDDDINS